MTTNAIRYITALMALASGILAIGDKLSAMPGLPGWLTSSWPIVSAAALAFHTFAQTLITPADSAANKPQQSPAVPPLPVISLLACLCLGGCAKDGSGPTPEQLAAYEKLIHETIKDAAADAKLIKSFKTSAADVHWRDNGELNQDNPPPIVKLLPRAYGLVTDGL